MTEFLGTARYQPVRRLGAGGMGIVYEVFDRERGEHVALKTLSRIDPSGIYDLKKEFRSLADVRHPNVVTLYEMVNDDDRWFFTMELVHGSPFTEHVARDALRARPEVSSNGLTITETRIDPRQGRPFDELRLRAALAQLVLGVSAIHAAGRLHRDLKPSNVLVTGEGRVVVLDFGLVQDDGRSEPADTSLDDHWLVGTPAYMAPEQAAGHRATKATDWYAVGAMLYRALTGQLPFDGSVNEVLLRKQAEEPRAPSSLVDGLPQDLEQLALHLIQRNVDARADEAAVRRYLALDSAPARITLPAHERLVGREVELGWLQHALDQSRRGVPQVLFLEGPSGFGKTALAQDFSREVRRDPSAVVLSGRCYPREALPYRAFDAVIDALSRYLSRLPEARAHELLPRNCRALTSLFPVLERVSAIQNQRSLALPPATLAEQRERAFGALKELLARISDQGPLLLVIENLEWGDEDSAELLTRICSEPDPPALLLIGTHHPRAESEGAFFARLGARSPSLGAAVREHRSIGPLAPEHAFQLCKEKLHCPDRVAWRLAEETGGDPLLISLLCEHLREHPEGIPSGSRTPLEALVAFEIGRLDADTLACLDLITVAGAPVLPDDLGEALGLAQEAVRTCLAQLTDEGLLQLVYHQGRESVSVRHERIAGALIARMTPEELAGHHASWADALLARGHAEPETLADHYQKAGEESLARRYAIQAARRAERALAFDRAVHLYERALALAPKGPEQAEILEWLAETRLHLGQPGNAAAALLEAARLSPPERAAELRKRSAALRLTDEQLDALFSGGGNGEGLFDGITREAVQAFLAKGQLTDAAKGSCVSRRNDRPASVLVVLAGGLRVEQAAGNVELGPGEILGTLSFLHNTPRLADVYATTDGTRVLRITRASLEELNQTQPQLALQLTLNLARILCGKLVNVHARAFRLPG